MPLERKQCQSHSESMKATVLSLMLILAVFCSVQAQPLKVVVFSDQKQFLAQERMVLSVRMYNYTGQTLKLGAAPGWLTIGVEPLGSTSKMVPQNSKLDIMGEFELGTGMMATKHIEMIPSFEIVEPGRYKVTATVHFGKWGDISSEPYFVDIVSGIPVWQREFGVPSKAGTPPETRRYTLIEARHADTLQLYVKVTDTYESKVFGLRILGKLVSSQPPEYNTDRYNRLHVLQQTGRATFTYSLVDYDGSVILRQRYDYSDSGRPRLRPTEGGDIIVSGGLRVKSPSDIDPLAEEMEQKLQAK